MPAEAPRHTPAPLAKRRSPPRRNSPPAADTFPVVGLGASAGGLDAFRRLLAALPAGTGMVFILIQHLDPTHASMMVDLLAGHTPMTVEQAADGMMLEPEHIYLIPPGAYLSILGRCAAAIGAPANATVRVCRSIFSFGRWRKNSGNARSA